MNTVNFDGQWTRRVIERLGFGTAQGSSTRGAIEGLSVMAQRIKEGKHVAFTIDGPRGPRYVAKPGPVILARRTGSPISVFHIGLQHGYTVQEILGLVPDSVPVFARGDVRRARRFAFPPMPAANSCIRNKPKCRPRSSECAMPRNHGFS